MSAGRGQGAPGGTEGTDSMPFPDGQDGTDGPDGRVSLVLGVVEWQLGEPLGCFNSFFEQLNDTNTISGVQLCAGSCLSRAVFLQSDSDYELSFDYRWLTTSGKLDVHFAGQLVHSLLAPPALAIDFLPARIFIPDPAVLSGNLDLCLLPEGESVIQVANLVYQVAPDTGTQIPEINVHLANGYAVEFTWPSVAGQNYQLQTRASLGSADWTNIGPLLPGTGDTLTTSAARNPGQTEAYFRLLILLVP